jgi:hypothetical protein
MQELFDRSLLPKMVIDVTDKTPDEMVTDVADWLEATGAVTVPDMEPMVAEEGMPLNAADGVSDRPSPRID